MQLWTSCGRHKIWITMRNYVKHEIILSFIKVEKEMIWGKEQKEFRWNQYKTNSITMTIDKKTISLWVNNKLNDCLHLENTFNKIE